MRNPSSVIVGVTLNCNARCIMCDNWKNRLKNELAPEELLKLPGNFSKICLTGGEPFLRKDLDRILYYLKQKSPDAQVMVLSHGFMPEAIDRLLPRLLQIDSSLSFGISIDGLGKTHEAVRRIPGGFEEVLASLAVLKKYGVRKRYINTVLMEQNYREILSLYTFSKKYQAKLIVNAVLGRPELRPKNQKKLSHIIYQLGLARMKRFHPSEWINAWFEQKILSYWKTHQRAIPCDAGDNFFYLDSLGNVWGCPYLPFKLGNIREQRWEDIWKNSEAGRFRDIAQKCNQCWFSCATQNSVRKHLPRVLLDLFSLAVNREGDAGL